MDVARPEGKRSSRFPSLCRVSLRVKILVPVLVVILASGFSLAWVVHRNVLEALLWDFSSRVDAHLEDLAYRLTQDLVVENELGVQESLRRAAAVEDVVYLFVEDPHRGVIAHSFDRGMPAGLVEATWRDEAGLPRVVSLRTERGLVLDHSRALSEKGLGVIHMGVSPERIRQRASKVSLQIVWFTLFSAAGSLAFLFAVTHAVARPIDDLAKSLRRVGEGDFAVRSAPRSRDEVGELAAQFNAMTERLETWRAKSEEAQRLLLRSERLATIGKLASGIAHEIGNPLQAVQHLASSLEADPERVEEYLPMIREGLKRIHRVVHGLNGYARERRVRKRTVDLHEIIRDSLRLLEPQAKQRNVRFLFVPGPSVPRIEADPAALSQLVVNMVMNSLDAMAAGGTVSVGTALDARTWRERPEVVLRIADDGPGIDREILSKIFDPFFTTKEPGSGTGLGLAICQDIAALHGGSIEVESERGKGAAFTVRLPVEPPRERKETEIEADPARGR